MTQLSRRTFLGTSVALGVGVFFGRARNGQVIAAPTSSDFDVNEFIHLSATGVVSIVCARSEMGQGVRSSLPLLMADELGASFEQVHVIQGVGDEKYGDQNTDGSSSVRKSFDRLRRLAAVGRMQLERAAAARWNVSPASCNVHDHAVWHADSKRSFSFADLVGDVAKLPPIEDKQIVLRPRTELKHLGKPYPTLDGHDIVTGKAQFGADMRVEGMLVAVILRPPTVRGSVESFDASAALAVPGVHSVIQMPTLRLSVHFKPLGGVAVLASNTWAALKGRDALKVVWSLGENADYNSVAYREQLFATAREGGKEVRARGDVADAFAKASQVVTAEYYVPHLAHATMEPPVALAQMKNGKCEVWAPTQNPQAARDEVASITGLSKKDVTINVTLLGGGFGRKSKADFVAEAAFLAKESGRPVRVQWTREDDLAHSYYHTVSAQTVKAGLDANGKVTAWQQHTVFPAIPSTFFWLLKSPSSQELGQGFTELPLDVPNISMRVGSAHAHVRIGWLRSVCNIFHAFSAGSFIDELAHAAKQDPVKFCLDLIGPPRRYSAKEAGVSKFENYGQSTDEHPLDLGRYRQVIERVAALSKWGSAQPKNRALGFAAHRSFLADVAVVVAVERNTKQEIVVDEAWVVIDAGTVINMDRVKAQMEGAVVFGMSIAFHGAITFKDGIAEQRGLRDYRLIRINKAPRATHVEVIESDLPPRGVGEPGVPPIAPAIANAIFALTGERHRELPIRVA